MRSTLKKLISIGTIITILLILVPFAALAEGMQEYEMGTGADSAELLERIDELSAEVETLKAEKIEDPYREIDSMPGIGYNPRAKYYEVPEGFPEFDSRVRYIGNLRGTWEEMGYQYGERAGDLILTVYNYSAEVNIGQYGIDHLREDLGFYAEQLEAYSPQMIEFIKGIGEGASWVLADSPYSEDLNDFEKILLINAHYELAFFHPKPEQHPEGSIGRTAGIGPILTGNDNRLASTGIREHCTGLALSGRDNGDLLSPTKNGETIVTNHYDTAIFTPYSWNCAYVATPSDPEAHVYWSIQPAGMVGAANMIVNDKGVSSASFFGGQSVDHAYEFGVPTYPHQLFAVAYADTAEEAIDTMVFGTQNYRDKTGRTKALQTGLHAYILADSNQVMVLELTPHRHAVRYPGDMGEAGNYVIYANWYGADHYYDENNVRVDEPIGFEDPEFPERYWTYDWFIKYHMGELDEALVQEGQKSTYYFDKETGMRIDFLEGTPLPLYIGVHTISAYWGAALGMDIGGTAHGAQVVQFPNGRIKANWVQGRPSEWVGPWQSTDFYGYQK